MRSSLQVYARQTFVDIAAIDLQISAIFERYLENFLKNSEIQWCGRWATANLILCFWGPEQEILNLYPEWKPVV